MFVLMLVMCACTMPVLAQVAANQLLLAPVVLAVVFSWNLALTGQLEGLGAKLGRDLVPSMMNGERRNGKGCDLPVIPPHSCFSFVHMLPRGHTTCHSPTHILHVLQLRPPGLCKPLPPTADPLAPARPSSSSSSSLLLLLLLLLLAHQAGSSGSLPPPSTSTPSRCSSRCCT
jgi:hypothetical protein